MKVKLMKIRIAENLVAKDQQVLDSFLQNHQILKVESSFVNDFENESFWSVLIYFEEQKPVVKESRSTKYSAENDTELSSDEIKILDSLRIWRNEKAKENNLPSYFIATNKELLSIAKYKPIKKEELQEIKGFGKHKIENYGEEIIEILESI